MQSSTFATLLWLVQCLLVLRVAGFALLERAATPTPIAVAPAQNWDGDDGPWSSFTLQVGTPIQDVRVFVSTANPDTWVVLPQGCPTNDATCVENRGRTFNYNQSSTWSQHGFYEFATEQNLNMSVEAVFGNDTLGLGIQGSGGPVLTKQVIGAYSSTDFYIGMLGLNPASTNFTPQDQGIPSYMSTLKAGNLIPSLSFGYTAGNQYSLKQVLGSLTLGGYDSSRFSPNNLTIPLAPDTTRELMVGIQSISSVDHSGTTSNLLPTGIMSLVDSTVPQIWLPVAACQAFEKAFGLTFDQTTELYLVNSSLRTQLQAQNASVTFTLGATAAGGQTTNITLPYDSFDLLVSPPTPGVVNSSRYFPLRRAANESQYTLGRTFLQEAYLTVDWDRRNFSLSQCTFEENMQQTLVPIKSMGSKSDSGGSSTGKTAGIAVGVVVGVLAIGGAIGAYFFLRHKKYKKISPAKSRSHDSPSPDEVIRQGYDKGELDSGVENQRFEMAGSAPDHSKPEEQGPSAWVDEKGNYPGNRSGMAEADGGGVSVPELTGSASQQRFTRRPLHEMYDPSAPAVELPGDHPSTGELHGSNPTSAASSPGIFARRNRGSNPGSPISQTSRRRSFRERLSGRRASTLDSLPSLESPARGAPSPPVKDGAAAIGSGHSGEPFSPVSRQGTFTPEPISRQGTFTPEPVSRRGTFDTFASPRSNSNPLFSPVSPTSPSPEMHRGMFERLRGPGKQGR